MALEPRIAYTHVAFEREKGKGIGDGVRQPRCPQTGRYTDRNASNTRERKTTQEVTLRGVRDRVAQRLCVCVDEEAAALHVLKSVHSNPRPMPPAQCNAMPLPSLARGDDHRAGSLACARSAAAVAADEASRRTFAFPRLSRTYQET